MLSMSQLWHAIRDANAEKVAAGVLLLNLAWCSVWALRIALEFRHCGESECWSGLTFFVVWLGGELALAVPVILSGVIATNAFIRKRDMLNSVAVASSIGQSIIVILLTIYGARG
jgi:hypothetical protein